MNLPLATLLHGGTYKVIRQISSGGFGITYEAEHVMLQKRVAIKEFFVKDFCNRDTATSRVTVGTQSKVALVNKLRHKFMEEAKTLSTFHHPNIVHVSDVFEENGTAYYVMDYIEGHSLAEIINAKGKLTEAKALKYIRQVADALKYVHAHHRLHLDIKPGNIMIDNTDKAILIDFGASKQYDEANGENTSTLMGITTPGYAPIEQTARTFTTFSASTDIYALGATLSKLVTGITPPDSSLIVSEGLPPLPTYISASTRNAIEQAMKVRRQDRVQTVERFLSLLDNGKTTKRQVRNSKAEPILYTAYLTFIVLGEPVLFFVAIAYGLFWLWAVSIPVLGIISWIWHFSRENTFRKDSRRYIHDNNLRDSFKKESSEETLSIDTFNRI